MPPSTHRCSAASFVAPMTVSYERLPRTPNVSAPTFLELLPDEFEEEKKDLECDYEEVIAKPVLSDVQRFAFDYPRRRALRHR